MVIVSDMQVGKAGSNPLRAQLLVDYLSGHLGGASEQAFAASVVRVIVAGNSLPRLDAGSLQSHKPMDGGEQATVADPVRELDCLLTRLCASVPVDIMPGETDPANYMLPQQPLHRCLFQSVSKVPQPSCHSRPDQLTNSHFGLRSVPTDSGF